MCEGEKMTAIANPMRPYLGRLAGVSNLATGINLFQVELTETEGQAAFRESASQARLGEGLW